jgi:hypothetical protein
MVYLGVPRFVCKAPGKKQESKWKLRGDASLEIARFVDTDLRVDSELRGFAIACAV